MRYTLRLLTAQQFQRAAALICACELIRRERPASAGARRRSGSACGSASSVTPNRTAAAAKALEDEHGLGGPSGGRHSSPVQLVSCPWCGSDDRPGGRCAVRPGPLAHAGLLRRRSRSLRVHRDAAARHEGSPVVTVDEEIYRLLPVARDLHGRTSSRSCRGRARCTCCSGGAERKCTRHGYRSPDLDVVGDKKRGRQARPDGHPAAGRDGRRHAAPAARPDHPGRAAPDLRAARHARRACTRRPSTGSRPGRSTAGTVRPKVVASTATIRRAGDQVYALFWREVRVFPPPVLDVDDSFFAVQRPTSEVAGPPLPRDLRARPAAEVRRGPRLHDRARRRPDALRAVRDRAPTRG